MAARVVDAGAVGAFSNSFGIGPGTGVEGDYLLAVFSISGQTIPTPAGWTLHYEAPVAGGTRRVYIFGKGIGPAEPVTTFSFSGSGHTWGARVSLRGHDPASPFDVAAVNNSSSANASTLTAPSTDTATANALLLTFFTSISVSASASLTTPAGMTDVTSAVGTGSEGLSGRISSETRLTPGATGTRVSTCGVSAPWAATTFAIRPAVTSEAFNLTDVATAVDTSTVADLATAADTATGLDSAAAQDLASLPEAGAGVDAVAVVDVEHLDVADTGTGADAVATDDVVTEFAEAAEVGSGADAVTFTDADAAAAAEVGTGTDTVALVEDLALADSATGTETVAVGEQRAVGDTGQGLDAAKVGELTAVDDTATATDLAGLVESVVPLPDTATGLDTVVTVADGALLADIALGLDGVSILDIPFTPFLPLDPGPTYDVVVVARIPQQSGPPTFVETDPIEWKSIRYISTLSKPQQLTITCLIASLTEPVLQRLRRPKDLATEVWLLRDGDRVFAGPLAGWRKSGETLTVEAVGLLAYLRKMLIDSDIRFDQADQFAMATWMVDQWQGLEFGHFGIDTSTVGLSGKLRDGTYLLAEQHNVAEKVEQLGARGGGFDAEVDPASRKLQLWSPRQGVDRSTGEDAVVFDSRNITSGDVLCSVADKDLASEAYGVSTSSGQETPLLSRRENLELRATYGRTAVTGSFTDVSEQTTLDDHTQGLLDARAEPLLVPGPQVRVVPDADLGAYDVGDTVAYEVDAQLGVTGAFRIRSQTVTVGGTGAELVDIEFV